jgi:hypothetical protein
MSIELLLLMILAGLTLLAYMVALNSHGTTRLAISYLMATVILVGSVWATVQYVNSGDNRRKMEEFKRLETEKQKAEEQVHSQEAAMQTALRENKERLVMATRINNIITRAAGLSSTMMNANLRDSNLELDVLIGRASDVKRKTEDLASEFEKTKVTDSLFIESTSLIKEAFKQMTEAAQYFVLYYHAEDGAQEELRERIMRQKASGAHDILQKASTLIGSPNNQ